MQIVIPVDNFARLFKVPTVDRNANEIAQILPTESNPSENQLAKASHELVEDSFARMSDTVLSGDSKYILYVCKTFASDESHFQYDAFGVKKCGENSPT